MSDSSYIEDCLKRRLVLFTGKGGVGKTSLAWSTAMACQQRGMRVAVAAWSPQAPSIPGIDFIELETLSAFREYVVSVVRFEKVYEVVFDNPVLSTFVSAAPGLSDTVIGGKLWDLWDKRTYDLLVVDLPASGHAFQFFQSPHQVKKVFSVGVVHRNLERILALFQDPSLRLDLVTLPEELPVQETIELKSKLEQLHPPNFGFLHLNRVTPDFPVEPDVPAPLEEWRERYRAQKAHEQECQAPLAKLEMPMLSHFRLATTNGRETLDAFTRRLKGEGA